MRPTHGLASQAMLSTFAGGRLFGERTGSSEPWLLALHGWGRSHRDWSRVLQGLDAVALDLPGFGSTPAPPEPWGVAQYAEAVLPVLDEMRRPVVVLGHSFGGSVAVHLASRSRAGAIRALVLTGSPLIRASSGTKKPPVSFRVARWLHRRGLLSDTRMEELRQVRGSADYRAASGVMRDTLVRVVNEDVAPLLPGLEMPVQLVWGDQDGDVPVRVAEAAQRLIPAAKLTSLSGVGHDTPAQAAEQLRQVLRSLAPEDVNVSNGGGAG